MAYLTSPPPSWLPTTGSGQLSMTKIDTSISYKTTIGIVHAVTIKTNNIIVIPKENIAVSANTQYGFPIVG